MHTGMKIIVQMEASWEAVLFGSEDKASRIFVSAPVPLGLIGVGTGFDWDGIVPGGLGIKGFGTRAWQF